MAFVKEEREDVRIVEVISLRHEDTEEQTDPMVLKENCEALTGMEEKDHHTNQHDFTTGEESFSFSHSDETLPTIRSQNTGSTGYFTCQHCDKNFNYKGNLKTHMKIHTGEKSYTCPQCEKCFIHKISLTRHIRIHTGEKPYACQHCEKCFTQKGHLINHLRIHTGRSPFICPVCGISFAQKVNLKRHSKTHSKEQRLQKRETTPTCFKCQQCEKSFRQKYSLKRHMRVHTGEKEFMCCQCGKRFAYKSGLTYHEYLCMRGML